MASLSRNPVRLFLSYSSKDRTFCSHLKTELSKYGLNVFLAHQDIAPSIEWQKKILRQLSICDVFVPILTKNFRGSLWTDQESGFAMAHRKHVLPLAVGTMPYAFVARYQAVKGEAMSIREMSFEIVKSLAPSRDLRQRVGEMIVQVLGKSSSADDSGDILRALALLSPLSTTQLARILRKVNSNHTIFRAKAIRALRKIMIDNERRVDKNLLRRVEDYLW